MKAEKVTFEEAGCFSPLFLDYINKKAELKPFYNTFPDPKKFEKLIADRQFPEDKRGTLVEVLLDEYGPLRKTDAVDFNIHSLRHPKTFTVTTGHQLNIFTGPLYFIYKIVSVINTCVRLKKAYPDYHFVPVYWMATEDHDLAEISYFHLFGKKYSWNTDQTGPVGRMKPHTLIDVIHELDDEDVSLFEKAYLDYHTLADAVRHYVNKLFGDYGLVVVDGDNAQLKEMFAPTIKEEIFENHSNRLVEESSQKLKDLGYTEQAYSREINFFYLDDNFRERIVKEGDQFKVLNTDLTFTADEMEDLIESEPEKFSPNVILRPLYQETILPNLAYVGGPAEVSYWLQLKTVFEHYGVEFPVLMPRNFALLVPKATQKKIEKLKLKAANLFKDSHSLKEMILNRVSSNGFELKEEEQQFAVLFEKIKAKAEEVDKSLGGFVGAESVKTFKSLETIAKRLKKAEEQNNSTAMNQIDAIKDKLFPEGNLQERHDNFLTFYLNNPDFIQVLLNKFDPFNFHFQIIRDM
ncbi:bacillithiol biosynthesis cysteine-adding enzyme BshC [Marinoscillum sp. MHG1-6]|uniref:bacillithiol biosynthesis cysteine-adding enzyme BshC n=1 Tax=Marinoscillum sp. MHG1-6 TaxID=2959627 RepID=UPI002157CDEA|nr:bacillithiol biosynthesis cysteine-adding enzyme BshC [Marinoscillum sp. MHG1-6]